jgi:hypothetical protein
MHLKDANSAPLVDDDDVANPTFHPVEVKRLSSLGERNKSVGLELVNFLALSRNPT